ncbi:hypothetical protein [Thomasclavelia spiroformis]
MKKLTNRSWAMSWKYRSTKFRQFINGWIDYFYMA